MKIIVVGCGNVGGALVEQLSSEGHNISVIDIKEERVKTITNTYDVMGVIGNGAVYSVQLDAGVKEADLVIAVTGDDELNMLCCLIAKKAGGCHTIARVSTPVYYKEIAYIKEELGLSLVVNPEVAVAAEIARLLKFPSALRIDTFSRGRVELVTFRVGEDSPLCNMMLKEMKQKFNTSVLVCIAERGEEVLIPSGNFEMKSGDALTVVAPSAKVASFFKKIGLPTTRAHDTMIIGGGNTGFYLAETLKDMGVSVKMIERSKERCDELCELIPEAMIIHGDGTDRTVLMEEGMPNAESVVTLTNMDEENIMLSLFAKSQSKGKVITRLHRLAYDEIIQKLDLGSVVYPKNITAEHIVKYVRAMHNSIGSNIETLYKLNDNRVEALEFLIRDDCAVVGVPLQELKLKKNILVCSIIRRGNVMIPGGQSTIQVGDNVVVVTTMTGLHDIRDILE